MWESLAKWWNGTSNPPGKVICVKRITINNYCGKCDQCKPPKPTGPSAPPNTTLVLPKGDLAMPVPYIEVLGIPIPEGVGRNVQGGKLHIRVDGSAAVVSKPFDSYVPGAGGTASFSAPQGSSGDLSVTYSDQTGAEGLPGLHTRFTNLQDGIQPNAPVGALTIPAGDFIEMPLPEPFPPIVEPTEEPTEEPTAEPTVEPTEAPTEEPTAAPTVE
jgi:hypothetical protein